MAAIVRPADCLSFLAGFNSFQAHCNLQSAMSEKVEERCKQGCKWLWGRKVKECVWKGKKSSWIECSRELST